MGLSKAGKVLPLILGIMLALTASLSMQDDEPCTHDDYQCKLGACVDRSFKCNGIPECDSQSDEDYCDSLAIIFDAFYDVRLNFTSVNDIVQVNSTEECAHLCLNNEKFRCHSFDVITIETELTCAMAEKGYEVTLNEAQEDRNTSYGSLVHFELDPTVDGDAYKPERHMGFITSPGKFSDKYNETYSGVISWTIEPRGAVNTITFTFAGVTTDEEDKSPGSCLNFVDVTGTTDRAGTDADDVTTMNVTTTAKRICLYLLKMDNTVEIQGGTFTVDFYTTNVTTNQFVASYKAEWKCDEVIMVEGAGNITSPLYPSSYPIFLNCHTLLIAPARAQVILQLVHFDVSMCADGDGIAIYDGTSEHTKLLISCNSDVSEPPESLVSTQGALLIVFTSNDRTNTTTGFEFKYDYMPDEALCGLQTAPLAREVRIIGGKPAQEGEWPWQAAMLFDGNWQCGGSLVHLQWILSAAHCLRTAINKPEMYQFRMGDNKISGDSEHMQVRRAEAIYMHPQYKIYSGFDGDVALLKMETPFNITKYVRTVCLPQESMFDIPDSTVVTATGWGRMIAFGPTSEYLLEVELLTTNQTICAARWSEDGIGVTENMICVGRPGKSECQGDSGGPVVMRSSLQQWTLVGVVSFGTLSCNSDYYPNVNARVSSFVDWIQPIFEGNEPERQDSICSDDEYLCKLGGCVVRDIKCSGNIECVSGSDEFYCDSLELAFDPFYYVRLNESSIQETVTVKSTEECAKICLDRQDFQCYSFDVVTMETELTCAMAGYGFEVVPNVESSLARQNDVRSVMHFEIEPEIGTNFNPYKHRGIIVSPSKFSDGPYTGEMSGVFPRSVTPVGRVNTLTVTFAAVTTDEDESSGDCLNFVVANGTSPEGQPSTDVRFCLYELRERNTSIQVLGSSFSLAFHSSNVTLHQFVMAYEAEWKCDEVIMVEGAGHITSPLYPSSYPIFLNCHTLLIAPTGAQVILQLVHFDVSICALGDDFAVYDGTTESSNQLISCNSNVSEPPQMLSSSQGALLIVFTTDGSNFSSVQPGFNLTYYAEYNSSATTESPTESVTTMSPTELTTDSRAETTEPLVSTIKPPVPTEKPCDPDKLHELQEKMTTYKNALIGVSVAAGLLIIWLFFYVIYLIEWKSDLMKQLKTSQQAKEGVYAKENDYEMMEDPGYQGNANDGFVSIK